MSSLRIFLLLALVSLLSAPGPAHADLSRLDRLEARLSDAVGRDRLELLVELTTAYREERAERALLLGSEALELLRSDPDRDREVETLNSLAYAHIVLGEYQLPLRLAVRAEHLARAANDKPALALAYRNIGRVYRFTSEHELALSYYGEAVDLYQEIDEKPGWGDSLNDTGIVYWMMGEHPKALEYMIRAHQTYEAVGDRRRIASTLNNIAIVYKSLQQYPKALEFYHQALELRRLVGPKGSIANVLNNIGNIYNDLGDPARALEYYLDSLATGPADKEGESNTTMNIGRAHQHLGDLDRALEYFKKALALKEETGNKLGIVQILLNTAEVYRRTDELDLAVETLRRSLALAVEISARDEIAKVCQKLSGTYADLGRFEEALEAFQRYEKIKDEIFNEENSRNLAEMQARFEADQKQKEIESLRQQQAIDALELKWQETTRRALLGGLVILCIFFLLLYNRYRFRLRTSHLIERQNRKLEQAMSALESKNTELERFTYTVSHDLKAPIVTIKGFVGFLKRDVAAGNQARVLQDVERVDGAAEKMGTLVEDLLSLSRVGRMTHPPEDVPFCDLVAEALELVAGQIDERGVEVEVAPGLPVVHGDRTRLLEVVQNLIENAVKYMGDQGAPRLEVGVRREGATPVFTVHDNGSGIEPQYHEKVFGLFERLDLEVSEGTGVGLALVKRIVEVHGGRIWVESEGKGRGSFCLTLPGSAGNERSIGIA